MDVNTYLECLELRIFSILTRFLSVEGGAPRHLSRGSYSAHRHLQVSHYTFIQVASAEGFPFLGRSRSPSHLIDCGILLFPSKWSESSCPITSLRPSLTQLIWQQNAALDIKKYCKGQSDTWNLQICFWCPICNFKEILSVCWAWKSLPSSLGDIKDLSSAPLLSQTAPQAKHHKQSIFRHASVSSTYSCKLVGW